MKLECLKDIVLEARSLGIECTLTNQGLEVKVRAESKRHNIIAGLNKLYDWETLVTQDCQWRDVIIQNLHYMRTTVNNRLALEVRDVELGS